MNRKISQKPVTLYAGLTALVGLLFVTSFFVGPSAVSPGAIWHALVTPDQSPSAIIVHEIRLPRTILAALVGATLGLAGATLQGLLRNPLAEPGIIGASSAAALGASLVLYFGLADIAIIALPIAGMTGALVAVALLFLLAGRDASPLALILAGVAISSFASALTALAINLASSAYAALEITFWLLGSLTDRSMTHVALAAPAMVVGWLLMLSGARIPPRASACRWSRCVCVLCWGSRSRSVRQCQFRAPSVLSDSSCRICCGLMSGSSPVDCWVFQCWAARRSCWPPIFWSGSYRRGSKFASAW
jgi:ABC-type Fe3+-siderophore transport system permease subunit